ncbi:hypothetical protein [Lysobacter sp. FW306-1B-D06B]|uniref:hypothetical protein n=1 Tax=Lysobacter sp. FW306-1B-D06B TaxID=3140250 RepID=UPI0031401BA3
MNTETSTETPIISTKADLLYFRLLRKHTAQVTLTKEKLVVQRLIVVKDEYMCTDIESYYTFKVAFLIPIGIGIKFRNGTRVEFAPMFTGAKKWRSALQGAGFAQSQ